MSELLAVEVTARAASQLLRAASWWSENRLDAPNAIAEDFEEAKNVLARQPGIGARSASKQYPDLRRLYLARVKYHLYYRVVPGKVVVLAFWHASRGAGPSL